MAYIDTSEIVTQRVRAHDIAQERRAEKLLEQFPRENWDFYISLIGTFLTAYMVLRGR